MAKSTELVVSKETFPILAAGYNVAEVIRQNMGGEQITAQDLNRIRVPTGGATTWSVPSVDGGDEAMKALQGVIMHIARRRAYWKGIEVTGLPPDCASSDCTTGIGDPGGDCELCPNNQFGSAISPDGSPGAGKACKETKLIFLLREGQMLPDVVIAPPGSLKAMRQYQFRLPAPFPAVVTKLELAKATSRNNHAYAQVVPTMVGRVPEELARATIAYAQQLHDVFSATVSSGDFDENASEETFP